MPLADTLTPAKRITARFLHDQLPAASVAAVVSSLLTLAILSREPVAADRPREAVATVEAARPAHSPDQSLPEASQALGADDAPAEVPPPSF